MSPAQQPSLLALPWSCFAPFRDCLIQSCVQPPPIPVPSTVLA